MLVDPHANAFSTLSGQVLAVQSNVVAAFMTSAVEPRACAALGLSIVVTAAIVLPFVILSGFARRENRALRSHLPPALKLRALVGTFLMPGLLEETLYRAALLPRLVDNYAAVPFSQLVLSEHTSNAGLTWQAVGALAIFVGMHPVNGLFLRKEARATFCDWRFLSAAAIVGVICSVLYLETGTVWAPAVLHWIVVAVWFWCFDGLERLHLVQVPEVSKRQ